MWALKMPSLGWGFLFTLWPKLTMGHLGPYLCLSCPLALFPAELSAPTCQSLALASSCLTIADASLLLSLPLHCQQRGHAVTHRLYAYQTPSGPIFYRANSPNCSVGMQSSSQSGLYLSPPPQLPTLQLHRIPSSRVDGTPSYANTLAHLLCAQNMIYLLFSRLDLMHLSRCSWNITHKAGSNSSSLLYLLLYFIFPSICSIYHILL